MADRIYYHQGPMLDNQQTAADRGRSTESRGGGLFRRIIFILLFVGSALFVAELLFQSVIAPRMAITSIVIESDLPIARERILSYAGITENDLFFSLDTERIEAMLQNIPRVKLAKVEKQFPDTLKIALTARTPLAVSLTQANGRLTPVAIDAEGVMYAWGMPASYQSLPVLSGFDISNPELGARLPTALRGVLADLENLRMRHPVLFDVVSEIVFEPVHEHRMELTLFFIHAAVPVKVGDELIPEKISGIIRILDVLTAQGLLSDIAEIDFRGDDVVYTKREG